MLSIHIVMDGVTGTFRHRESLENTCSSAIPSNLPVEEIHNLSDSDYLNQSDLLFLQDDTLSFPQSLSSIESSSDEKGRLAEIMEYISRKNIDPQKTFILDDDLDCELSEATIQFLKPYYGFSEVDAMKLRSIIFQILSSQFQRWTDTITGNSIPICMDKDKVTEVHLEKDCVESYGDSPENIGNSSNTVSSQSWVEITQTELILSPLWCNPICFLATQCKQENQTKRNVITVSWLTPTDNKGSILLSLNSKRYSFAQLIQSKRFSLSTAVEGQQDQLWDIGQCDGDIIDKSEIQDYPEEHIFCIRSAAAHLICDLIKAIPPETCGDEGHMIIVAQVIKSYARRKQYLENGKFKTFGLSKTDKFLSDVKKDD